MSPIGLNLDERGPQNQLSMLDLRNWVNLAGESFWSSQSQSFRLKGVRVFIRNGNLYLSLK